MFAPLAQGQSLGKTLGPHPAPEAAAMASALSSAGAAVSPGSPTHILLTRALELLRAEIPDSLAPLTAVGVGGATCVDPLSIGLKGAHNGPAFLIPPAHPGLFERYKRLADLFLHVQGLADGFSCSGELQHAPSPPPLFKLPDTLRALQSDEDGVREGELLKFVQLLRDLSPSALLRVTTTLLRGPGGYGSTHGGTTNLAVGAGCRPGFPLQCVSILPFECIPAPLQHLLVSHTIVCDQQYSDLHTPTNGSGDGEVHRMALVIAHYDETPGSVGAMMMEAVQDAQKRGIPAEWRPFDPAASLAAQLVGEYVGDVALTRTFIHMAIPEVELLLHGNDHESESAWDTLSLGSGLSEVCWHIFSAASACASGSDAGWSVVCAHMANSKILVGRLLRISLPGHADEVRSNTHVPLENCPRCNGTLPGHHCSCIVNGTGIWIRHTGTCPHCRAHKSGIPRYTAKWFAAFERKFEADDELRNLGFFFHTGTKTQVRGVPE